MRIISTEVKAAVPTRQQLIIGKRDERRFRGGRERTEVWEMFPVRERGERELGEGLGRQASERAVCGLNTQKCKAL